MIDNGLSLSAHTGVVSKRYSGPREGQSIGPKNLQRLRDIITRQPEIEKVLKPYLEDAAVAGLFARAKALLVRGTYGNFNIHEINPYLPEALRAKREVGDYELDQ